MSVGVSWCFGWFRVAVSVAVGCGVSVGVSVGVGVPVGVSVAVGSGVSVGVSVGSGVLVDVAVGSGVAVGVAVGSGVAVGGGSTTRRTGAARSSNYAVDVDFVGTQEELSGIFQDRRHRPQAAGIYRRRGDRRLIQRNLNGALRRTCSVERQAVADDAAVQNHGAQCRTDWRSRGCCRIGRRWFRRPLPSSVCSLVSQLVSRSVPGSVSVAVGSGVSVGVSVGVGVPVGVSVAVGSGVSVAVSVGSGVLVDVAVGSGVSVGVAVGSGVAVGGGSTTSRTGAARSATTPSRRFRRHAGGIRRHPPRSSSPSTGRWHLPSS